MGEGVVVLIIYYFLSIVIDNDVVCLIEKLVFLENVG